MLKCGTVLPVHGEDLQEICVPDQFDLLAGQAGQEETGQIGFLLRRPAVKHQGGHLE